MQTLFKNITDFKNTMESNEDLQNQFKNDPVAAAKMIEQSPLQTDKWIYRIVVLALGITILSIIIGMLILIGHGRFEDDTKVPTILTAIGSAAIGALGGLLAPSPNSSQK